MKTLTRISKTFAGAGFQREIYIKLQSNQATMTRMLVCVICACFLFSCQKEVTETLPNNGGGSTSYYIKGKLDGVDFNYTAYAMAVRMDFNGFQTLAFVGGPVVGGMEG